MYWQRIFSAAMVCLVISGCHGGVETDILERELRLQEDHVYQLKDCLAHYRQLLTECQADKVKTDTQSTGKHREDPRPHLAPESDGPSELDSDLEIEPPVIEPGIPAEPEPLDTPQTSPEFSRLIRPPSDEFSATTSIDQITFNPDLTGIWNHDGRDGSGGIIAVIEPTRHDGQVVPIPGQLSLMILDPNKSGSSAHIARWDFDEKQTSQRWRNSPTVPGLYVDLPWPDGSPTADPCVLWARFNSSNGHKFLTQISLDASANAPTASRWLPTKNFVSRKDAPRLDRVAQQSLKGRRFGQPRGRQPVSSHDSARPRRSARTVGKEFQPTESLSAVIMAKPVRPVWKPYR